MAVLRPDIQVVAEIAAIDQMITRAMERALPSGISRPQFNLLTLLAESGLKTPGELAVALNLTKGAITNLVIRLEAGGWIALAADAEDRRRKRVRLTEAGLNLLRDAHSRLAEPAAAMRAALSADEFNRTLPLLTTLRRHLADVL